MNMVVLLFFRIRASYFCENRRSNAFQTNAKQIVLPTFVRETRVMRVLTDIHSGTSLRVTTVSKISIPFKATQCKLRDVKRVHLQS